MQAFVAHASLITPHLNTSSVGDFFCVLLVVATSPLFTTLNNAPEG